MIALVMSDERNSPTLKPRPYLSLQDWMERTGTTQKELARKARIGEPHLSRILTKSRRCSLDAALRLSHVTGVPVENLVAWTSAKRRASFERTLKRNARIAEQIV